MFKPRGKEIYVVFNDSKNISIMKHNKWLTETFPNKYSPVHQWLPLGPIFNLHYKDAIVFSSICVMKSTNGNIFRVTGHLCGEFTGRRWISRTKASDAELWCFLWSAPEWTFE